MKEIIIDDELCIGCSSCVDMCPADEPVLQIVDEKAVVIGIENCTDCYACGVNCEYEAIKCVED